MHCLQPNYINRYNLYKVIYNPVKEIITLIKPQRKSKMQSFILGPIAKTMLVSCPELFKINKIYKVLCGSDLFGDFRIFVLHETKFRHGRSQVLRAHVLH